MISYKQVLKAILIALSTVSFCVHADVRQGEPIPPIPLSNHGDSAISELGDELFHDPRFSSDQTTACASCHSLHTGGVDKLPVSRGAKNRQGMINAPTVFNSKFNFKQFWDGRAINLADQIEGPIHNKHEMDSSWSQVISVIKSDDSYMKMFADNFDDGVTVKNVKDSIVAFENTLVTPNSRFDQYLRGDDSAITPDELAGYKLFKSYGCVSCHQGVNIGGNLFQKLGIVNEYTFSQLGSNNRDLGRFNITKQKDDMHVFKVPSLRNVAVTAPYLHDGSVSTLEGVVAKMMFHQLGVPSSKEDIDLIVKFLKTLTGEYKNKLLK